VIKSAGKFMGELLEIWFFEDQKALKTLACLEGAWDFLSGRYGERRSDIGIRAT
jgi:hypothetical protein